ncbi:MAG: hypothetical protein QXH91_09735 [Candidatus Bathyarchaeia archaeon]
MQKAWKKILDVLDLPGGAILGVYSVVMIGMTIYCCIKGQSLPDGAVQAYSVVVGAFALTNISEHHSK